MKGRAMSKSLLMNAFPEYPEMNSRWATRTMMHGLIALHIGARRRPPIDFSNPDVQTLVMNAQNVEKAKRGLEFASLSQN
jgi:hypothetical protein